MRNENRKYVSALLSVLLLMSAALAVTPAIGATGGRAGEMISGRVFDQMTNGNLSGAQVTLVYSGNSTQANITTTGPNGMYSFNVLPDNYILNCSFTGYQYNAQPVVVNTNDVLVRNVGLMQLPSIVSGNVKDANNNQPLAGVAVSLTNGQNPMGNANNVTDANGNYSLQTYSGSVNMMFTKTGYAPQNKMEMIAVNDNKVVDASLVPQSSKVSGFVNAGGNAIKGADVILMTGPSQMSTTTTNDMGYYEFSLFGYGLKYNLGVLLSGYYYYDTGFSLALGESHVENVTLEAIPLPTSTIWGYIFDKTTTQPVVGAGVTFQEKDSTKSVVGLSGAGGYYTVALSAGYYKVVIEAMNYLSFTTMLDVLEGTKQVDYQISPRPQSGPIVSGTVTDSATLAPLADVFIELVDENGATIQTNTDAAGAYSMMAYNGNFDLRATADDYFDYKEKITVSAATSKDLALIPVPAMANTVWGYVKNAAGTPVGSADVILYDLQANHTGYMVPTTTSAGGYYTMQVYNGSFLLVGMASGYASNVSSLTVSGGARKDILLDTLAAMSTEAAISFLDWNNMTMTAKVTLAPSEGNSRFDIDRTFGNGDGTVSQAEADAYLGTLLARGPMMRDSKLGFTVDGLYYKFTEGTFTVTSDNLQGSDSNATPIVLIYGSNFTSNDTVPEAKVHLLKYNATYDTPASTSKVTVNLPHAAEMRKVEQATAAVKVSGGAVVTIDPLVRLPGVNATSEWVVLNVSKNEPPLGDTNGNQTLRPGLELIFDASSSSDDFGITNYTWEFGDGTFGYGVKVNHTYGVANDTPMAKFVVNLTITDSGGLTNTTNLTVILDGQKPSAGFMPDKDTTVVERTQPVEVNASLSTDNVGIAKYSWDWGDARSGEGMVTNHSYYDPGKYNLTLNVTDKAGNWATKTIVVTVLDNTTPVARFISNVTTAPANILIEFNGTTSSDNVAVTKWVWDFGDNTSKVEGNDTQASVVNHSYAKEGTYNVTLNVTDGKFFNETTQTVTVTAPLIFADLGASKPTFSSGNPAEGDKVTITVKVTNSGQKEAKDFTVRFQDGTKKIADRKVTLLGIGASKTLTVDWTTSKKGDHTIKVVIDVLSVIPESNETNNEVSAKLKVEESKTTMYIAIAAVAVVFVIIGAVLYSRRKESADEDEEEEDEEEEEEEEDEDEEGVEDEEIEDEEAEESECPKCYAEVKPSDKKCPSCGANLRR